MEATPNPIMALPLEGTRILTISSFGAGPWATMMLADLGAEVIKIEDRRSGGDTSRSVPPLQEGLDGDSLYFQALNRNKRSLTLDLRAAEGQRIFRELVRISDAVYNNLRGDQPPKLGLRYEDLSDVNPRVVCASCSGFGSGSRAAEPGYDFIVQALAGFMALTGEPDGPPARCGVSVVDFSGGLISIVGLLSALLRARETGRGGNVETSLYEGALSMLNYLAAWNLNLGFQPARLARSAHQSIVPSQTFQTRDGWIFVMCMKDKFFVRLAELLDRPALASDPRFRTIADRYANRDELLPILGEAFLANATDHWLRLLRGEVPCAPVNDLQAALQDPYLADELGFLWEIDHPELGTLREVGCPIRLPQTHPSPRRRAPRLGEDSEKILAELLGLSEAEISRLQAAGVV